MASGKLVVINNKTLQVQFTNAKGKEVSLNIKESELSASLTQKKKTSLAELNGLEVEFEEVAGQPKQIREKGTLFQAPQSRTVSLKREITRPTVSSSLSGIVPMGDFHNPYNFVPALPRNSEVVQKSELGDQLPACHGSYIDEGWSGKISITLRTVTPLLIPDAANLTEKDDHKTYEIRKVDGQPYLAPTSIKGMLRSAYEAVTNSRLSVFAKHEDRLAYRMPAQVGDLIPARVERRENQLVLRILKKSEILGHAGKLPRYQTPSSERDKGESKAAIKYDDSDRLPQHGDPVWVRLNNGVVTRLRKWTVTPPGRGEWLKGWVCITGANISGKKYERVFIESGENETIFVTDEMQSLWKELISNYQKTHEKDLEERRKKYQLPQDYLGNKPGKTAWSRHVYLTSEVELKEGSLCYVEFNNSHQVTALVPVSISRRLYNISPQELLEFSLHPATDINHLSPADRVFGWVNQNGQGSYKGNLRISAVECESANAVENFAGDGLPLAILGQPKPQQARFYVAKDNQGTPLNQGISKQEGYQVNYGLRGRKVYPHHANLPAEYWENPLEDRTQNAQNGHFQEYRRPQKDGKERDDQNRSIKGWVKPDVTFNFEIDVTNLSEVELGGILWLLSLPEGCYHRLGGGKPLGFGSVKLAINWEKTDLRTGKEWREFYCSLEDIPNSNSREAAVSINKFKDAVVKVYGDGQFFEEVLFIKAFYRGAQGFDDNKPVHYPRKRQQQGQNTVPPHPEGKAFEWFVANEKVGNPSGPKVSLPALWDEQGLPYFDPS